MEEIEEMEVKGRILHSTDCRCATAPMITTGC